MAGAAELPFGDISPSKKIVAWPRVPWSSNMNITMAWAWMFRSSDAVEHEHDCSFGMDALVIGRGRT